MGQFDYIRKKEILDAPETVNTDWESPSFSLDDRVGAFSTAVKFEEGNGLVNMKVWFQLSNDNENFGDIDDSDALIVTDSGVVLFDLEGSGAAFARIRIEVTSGSINVVSILYNALQLH